MEVSLVSLWKRRVMSRSNKIDEKALHESLSDTALGALINFPLSWVTIAATLVFTQNALIITTVQLIVLTTAAIVRRYYTRLYFKNREGESNGT